MEPYHHPQNTDDAVQAALFDQAVAVGLAHEDWAPLDEWITRFSRDTFNYGHQPEYDWFPNSIIQSIHALLRLPRFLESPGSWNVLRVLEQNWSQIRADDQASLLPAMEAAYPCSLDPMAWFLIAELLGEYYADEPALAALCRLKSQVTGGPRELLPMGFQQLFRNSGDERLRLRALQELLDMLQDADERVRDEAAGARAGLVNRGLIH